MRKPAWAFCLWVFGSVTTNPDTRTRGQRWADAVTSFGGSWLFIGTFIGSSAGWVLWNIFGHTRPDPYPFLFLNMLLTVISTFQQPFVYPGPEAHRTDRSASPMAAPLDPAARIVRRFAHRS